MIRAFSFPLLLLALPAAAGAAQYHAAPMAAQADGRFVVRDMIWRCGQAGCMADRSGARPAIVCASLAREVGRLSSFTAEGRAFDAAALEKCNAHAR